MGGLSTIDQIPDGAGAIGLFSSDEFAPGAREFDLALLEATGPEVVALFCADHGNRALNARLGARHFSGLGARLTPLPVDHHPARVKEIPPFDLLYIPGGSPTEILGCVRGSALWDDILERWRAGAGIAGSSAGAMSLSEHCMVPRPGDGRPTEWGKGLGPLREIGLAVHASSRPTTWLQQMADVAPVPLLAIDDSTGVLLRNGATPVVIGMGSARIVKKSV